MYPYLYPAVEVASPCYYCAMYNKPYIQASEPAETKSMMRDGEEPEGESSETGRSMPPMGHQMPSMGQQMPGMGHQMPGAMNMGKINANTQEIVRMFEQQHPEMLRPLTACGMSMGQARQYLSRIVEMSLMHHMMHQM